MPMKISAERACSVVNPKAANRKWLRRTKVRSYLQKSLPGPVQDDLADKETTIRKVRDLCADRDLIIAIGGDGTVADVIQGILESGREKKSVWVLCPWEAEMPFGRRSRSRRI